MSKLLTLFPRIRFRLRTVLLLVTLPAIPCAWIGPGRKIVRDRAALIERVEAAGGTVSGGVEEWFDPRFMKTPPKSQSAWDYIPEIVIDPGTPPFGEISKVRRWLGDRSIISIRIPGDFPDDEEKRIHDLFPHTTISKFYPRPQDRQTPRSAIQ
jgi:hypothetical protein